MGSTWVQGQVQGEILLGSGRFKVVQGKMYFFILFESITSISNIISEKKIKYIRNRKHLEPLNPLEPVGIKNHHPLQ